MSRRKKKQKSLFSAGIPRSNSCIVNECGRVPLTKEDCLQFIPKKYRASLQKLSDLLARGKSLPEKRFPIRNIVLARLRWTIAWYCSSLEVGHLIIVAESNNIRRYPMTATPRFILDLNKKQLIPELNRIYALEDKLIKKLETGRIGCGSLTIKG